MLPSDNASQNSILKFPELSRLLSDFALTPVPWSERVTFKVAKTLTLRKIINIPNKINLPLIFDDNNNNKVFKCLSFNKTMNLKKCKSCNTYTLKNNCSKCKEKTSDAHYKFIKIRSVSESNE